MRRPILKNSNKKLKGNISLLVILILLASSVIGLLSINQIQRLITYGNMTFNYFRAYYLAKAGTELGLTEVHYREAGFKQTINSGDAIVTENLVGVYSGFNPYFTMNISGNFQHLTNDVRYTNKCDDDNKITLGTGEGIMLSLFRDNTQGIIDSMTGTSDIGEFHYANNLKININTQDWEGNRDEQKLTFGLFDYDANGDMGSIFVEKISPDKLNKFLENNFKDLKEDRKYLTIKNPGTGNEVVSFCITTDNNALIPYSDSLITVRGNYGDMEVGIQSVVKKGVPDWALNVLGE